MLAILCEVGVLVYSNYMLMLRVTLPNDRTYDVKLCYKKTQTTKPYK